MEEAQAAVRLEAYEVEPAAVGSHPDAPAAVLEQVVDLVATQAVGVDRRVGVVLRPEASFARRTEAVDALPLGRHPDVAVAVLHHGVNPGKARGCALTGDDASGGRVQPAQQMLVGVEHEQLVVARACPGASLTVDQEGAHLVPGRLGVVGIEGQEVEEGVLEGYLRQSAQEGTHPEVPLTVGADGETAVVRAPLMRPLGGVEGHEGVRRTVIPCQPAALGVDPEDAVGIFRQEYARLGGKRTPVLVAHEEVGEAAVRWVEQTDAEGGILQPGESVAVGVHLIYMVVRRSAGGACREVEGVGRGGEEQPVAVDGKEQAAVCAPGDVGHGGRGGQTVKGEPAGRLVADEHAAAVAGNEQAASVFHQRPQGSLRGAGQPDGTQRLRQRVKAEESPGGEYPLLPAVVAVDVRQLATRREVDGRTQGKLLAVGIVRGTDGGAVAQDPDHTAGKGTDDGSLRGAASACQRNGEDTLVARVEAVDGVVVAHEPKAADGVLGDGEHPSAGEGMCAIGACLEVAEGVAVEAAQPVPCGKPHHALAVLEDVVHEAVPQPVLRTVGSDGVLRQRPRPAVTGQGEKGEKNVQTQVYVDSHKRVS